MTATHQGPLRPGAPRDRRGHSPLHSWTAFGAAVIAAVVVAVTVFSVIEGVGATDQAVAAPTVDVPAVQNLYAQDLVSRINAERAARLSFGLVIPTLQVDPGLAAYAQAWSAHLASTGVVADPPLSACNGATGQVCIMAANSGETGNGYWPGDGSDGMNGLYMASAPHRQNMLGAAYSDVGVGVTCSGGRAWTVEVFGYPSGDIPGAVARQSVQNAVQGQPVPAAPVVAGAPSGDPVYCPGQTIAANGAVTAAGGQVPYPFRVASIAGEPNVPAPTVGMAATADSGGYWLARSDGSVAVHGDAVSHGSMGGSPLNAPISHIVATGDGRGYWLVAADGGIFTFGDAGFFGSMGGKHLNAPVVGMAPTPSGHGYWLVASDGGVFSFGDAAFRGSMGGRHLNAPVVGMASDGATGGYWLVASDGGVFSFGAPFFGSTGSLDLNRPVNGMAVTADGRGYWFVASDGGIFAFGDAAFRGSAGATPLNAPVMGMTGDSATGGYWLVASDGGVFSYGAPFFGAG